MSSSWKRAVCCCRSRNLSAASRTPPRNRPSSCCIPSRLRNASSKRCAPAPTSISILRWPIRSGKRLRRSPELVPKARPAQPARWVKSFGFLSARGGCGATTFVIHLATDLARLMKQPMLVADFDFEAGLLRFMMKSKATYSVRDALDNLHRMDSSLWKGLVSSHANRARFHFRTGRRGGETSPGTRRDDAPDAIHPFDVFRDHHRLRSQCQYNGARFTAGTGRSLSHDHARPGNSRSCQASHPDGGRARIPERPAQSTAQPRAGPRNASIAKESKTFSAARARQTSRTISWRSTMLIPKAVSCRTETGSGKRSTVWRIRFARRAAGEQTAEPEAKLPQVAPEPTSAGFHSCNGHRSKNVMQRDPR